MRLASVDEAYCFADMGLTDEVEAVLALSWSYAVAWHVMALI